MQYEWGKRGSTSAVAALLRASGGAVDASAPYAELWVGTHAAGPSTLAGSREALQDWLLVRARAAAPLGARSPPPLFRSLSLPPPPAARPALPRQARAAAPLCAGRRRLQRHIRAALPA